MPKEYAIPCLVRRFSRLAFDSRNVDILYLLTMKQHFPYSMKETMRLLGWFGPPKVMYRGQVIDGRERAAVADELGLTTAAHTTMARNSRQAARLLIAAGHYDRAAQLGLFPFDPADSKTCLQWAGLDKPAKAIIPRRVHEPRIRAQAIDRLKATLERARARGEDTIPIYDVKEILSRWL
jgi:hypothetical protein